MSAGALHTCATTSDNRVHCWGLGEDPDEVEDSLDYDQASAPDGDYVHVSAGLAHSCALRPDGTAFCWGAGEDPSGRSGGLDADQSVAASGFFEELVSGGLHTCGRKAGGEVTCWGDEFALRDQPDALEAVSLSANGPVTCAVRANDGGLTCWGGRPLKEPKPPKGKFSDVAVGHAHGCAIREDGSVRCWMFEGLGKIDPDMLTKGLTDAPEGSFVDLTAGHAHTCGLRKDGRVECWGAGADGVDSRRFEMGQATPPKANFVAISAGDWHTCGLQKRGDILCWGAGTRRGVEEEALTGVNDFSQSQPPKRDFVALAAGFDHTCGVDSSGSAICWGSNLHGESDAPDAAFRSLAAARMHTCGIEKDQSVTCWGMGTEDDKSEGVGDTDQASPPERKFRHIAARDRSTCGLTTDNKRYCWGQLARNEREHPTYLELALGPNMACGIEPDFDFDCWVHNTKFSEIIPEGPLVTASIGGAHGCGIRPDGTLECWGLGSKAEHGITSSMWGDAGQAMPPDGIYASVAAGGEHTCALTLNGRVRCWGSDEYGQASPPTGEFWHLVSGAWHSCAIGEDARAVCWGLGSRDEVEGGSADYDQAAPSALPATVAANPDATASGQEAADTWLPAGRRVVSLSAGAYRACAVRADGQVQCWGKKLDPPEGEFVEVSVMDSHACGIRKDGQLACWGRNDYGKADPPSGKYRSVSVGVSHSCAVGRDGRIKCWGLGSKKADLEGRNIDSNPVDAPEGRFVSVSVGRMHACALDKEGKATCWGRDEDGESAAPAGPFTDIQASDKFSCGLRPDGTVSCWGKKTETTRRPPAKRFSRIAVSSSQLCGVLRDGQTRCWWSNERELRDEPQVAFDHLASGYEYACGVRPDGSLTCWGDKRSGRTKPPREIRPESAEALAKAKSAGAFAFGSKELASTYQLARLPAGLRVFAAKATSAKNWKTPIATIVPVVDAGSKWARLMPAADMPSGAFACTGFDLSAFDVELYVRKSDLPWVTTRAETVAFDDGTLVSVAPGVRVEVPKNFAKASGEVQVTLRFEDYRVPVQLPAERVGKTYKPQRVTSPNARRGDRTQQHYALITDLRVAGNPPTDLEMPEKTEKKRAKKKRPKRKSGSILAALGHPSSSGASGPPVTNLRVRAAYQGDAALFVHTRSRCGSVLASIEPRRIDRYRDGGRAMGMMGASRKFLPKGTGLYFPSGDYAGEIAYRIDLEGSEKRANGKKTCFVPGSYTRRPSSSEELTLCVSTSQITR